MLRLLQDQFQSPLPTIQFPPSQPPSSLPPTEHPPSPTHHHEDERANDHEDSLHKVCPDHRCQPSSDGEDGGHSEEEEDAEVEPLGACPVEGKLDEESTRVEVSLSREGREQ